MRDFEKWDRRFLALAEHVAGWSKDPSTKTGAVIVDYRLRVVSMGFNGFAQMVDDAPERYADRAVKYRMIVHCEMNAILLSPGPVAGCTLYTWPFASCAPCAAAMIQAGVSRCVAPRTPPDKAERWAEDFALAARQFAEAGVVQVILD